MSILDIPREVIILIANYLDATIDDTFFGYEEEENGGVKLEDTEYYKYNGNKWPHPLRNLYATCKSFKWMIELEFVCVHDSEFNADIICRNVNSIYTGMYYSGSTNLTGIGCAIDHESGIVTDYTDSAGPCGYFMYHGEYEYNLCDVCSRPWSGTCEKNQHIEPVDEFCLKFESFIEDGIHILQGGATDRSTSCDCKTHCVLCAQFDIMQKIIFEKDKYIECVFDNRCNQHGNSILVREKGKLLYFQMDLSSLKKKNIDGPDN